MLYRAENAVQCTYGCRLERESQREREDVTVVAWSPCLRTDPVMWVQEHDQARFRESGPERFQRGIIQARTDAPRANDDPTDVRVSSREL